MITSKDVREEIGIARKVMDSDVTVAEKIKALLKLIEVDKVPKIQPRRPKENAEKKTETKE